MSLPMVIAWTFPLRPEFLSWAQVLGLFVLLSIPIVWLGVRSLAGLGPVRKWVAIGVRLSVLLLFLLILAGVRYQRENKRVEVLVLRDISQSTAQVNDFPGTSLQASLDEWFRTLADDDNTDKTAKEPEDRIGVISYHSNPLIDAMPNTKLLLEARAIRETGHGTDVASAIQLGLATLSKDAMHRLMLVWDGNQTTGDLATAIAAANAQQVPIDVVPLTYDVQNEVLVERLVAPSWKSPNEPFSLDVILRSTNAFTVNGRLSVLHQNTPMDMDPYTEGVQPTRAVTLKPGLNVERVRVPAMGEDNVIHQFRAVFEAESVTESVAEGATAQQPAANSGAGGATAQPRRAGQDTLLANNSANAFTFVRGRGKVLYVDNVAGGQGQRLADELTREGIDVQSIKVDQFPQSIIQLQNYDSVILANVPRGQGGLSEEQQRSLAAYVHDTGGGLVMIGGPDTFGAGGWQGSRLEEILPVKMDVPAQRQIPKGALVLIMHSCEMPQGNFWGVQCATKAVEAVSEKDEVGIISYGWGAGGGMGGSVWDYELAPKGDGTKVFAAIKQMQLGDMPSFDDSMDLALNGRGGVGGLMRSDARQKHVIIISDGDPAAPNPQLMEQYRKAQVSVSTITVYPHMGDVNGLPRVMLDVANALNGRAYGPINDNPNQLPQIFIKEATVVRRTLIQENFDGIPLKQDLTASDLMKGLESLSLPDVYGLVLTSKKEDPQIEMPIVAGSQNDPLFAHWQSGLGRVAVFTSDAHARWAAGWTQQEWFGKFWAQVVRGVSRPPMSSDFDVQTVHEGTRGRITVEALDKDAAFLNFLAINGEVLGPDGEPREVRLVQTGPGTYTGEFDARDPGSYVVVMNSQRATGEKEMLLTGLAVNGSPELRDLQSNEAAVRQIAERTGGRELRPFEIDGTRLFTREGLKRSASPLPIWDILLPILLGLILVDVATRRIAWDWNSTKKMALSAVGFVRSYTTTRKVETRESLDALRRIREEGAARAEEQAAPAQPREPAGPRPDPTRKFDAAGQQVQGDITEVVGGATGKPIPSAPKRIEPKGAPGARETGGHTGSLLEAKRRARQQMEQREKDE